MKVELTVYFDEGSYEQASTKIEGINECPECGNTTVNKRPDVKLIQDALRHAANILFPSKGGH